MGREIHGDVDASDDSRRMKNDWEKGAGQNRINSDVRIKSSLPKNHCSSFDFSLNKRKFRIKFVF